MLHTYKIKINSSCPQKTRSGPMFPRLPRQHGSNSDPGAASAWSPRSPHVRFWIDQPNLEVGAPLITRSIAFFWGSYISSYDSYVYMSGYEWIWHIHVDLWWVYINNIYIYIYIYVYMCICIYIYMYIYICILVYYHPEGEEYEIFNMSMLLMFFFDYRLQDDYPGRSHWGFNWKRLELLHPNYPLVNIQKTIENQHFSWVNPL